MDTQASLRRMVKRTYRLFYSVLPRQAERGKHVAKRILLVTRSPSSVVDQLFARAEGLQRLRAVESTLNALLERVNKLDEVVQEDIGLKHLALFHNQETASNFSPTRLVK
jgi:hypothetical protein